MSDTHKRLDDIADLVGRLQEHYPVETNAFLSFMQKAEHGKALSILQKELINVGLSVAAQCDWCIAIHVQHAVAAGATRDQVIEAGFMAVVMHGGPALMYMKPLLDALDAFIPTA